jgi:hypothetical protein
MRRLKDWSRREVGGPTLYTTLGTGEVAMSSSWKLLGPFETADGMLAFGVSTAIVISVGQLIVRKKFSDLPNF